MPFEAISYSVVDGDVLVWNKGDIVARWPVGEMLMSIAKDMVVAKDFDTESWRKKAEARKYDWTKMGWSDGKFFGWPSDHGPEDKDPPKKNKLQSTPTFGGSQVYRVQATHNLVAESPNAAVESFIGVALREGLENMFFKVSVDGYSKVNQDEG